MTTIPAATDRSINDQGSRELLRDDATPSPRRGIDRANWPPRCFANTSWLRLARLDRQIWRLEGALEGCHGSAIATKLCAPRNHAPSVHLLSTRVYRNPYCIFQYRP